MIFRSDESNEEFFEKIITKNKKIDFISENHTYWYFGEELISVSRKIEKHRQPYPTMIAATGKANRIGIDVEWVLDFWELINKRSIFTGKCLHRFAESYPHRDLWPDHWIEASDLYWKKKKQFLRYWKKEMIGFKSILTEVRVFSQIYKVCGTVDKIFETDDNLIVIRDYKTNKDFFKETQEYFNPPMDNIIADHLHVYSIQLWIYNILLERMTGRKADRLEIVHFGEDKYLVIEALDMEKEAKYIIGV